MSDYRCNHCEDEGCDRCGRNEKTKPVCPRCGSPFEFDVASGDHRCRNSKFECGTIHSGKRTVTKGKSCERILILRAERDDARRQRDKLKKEQQENIRCSYCGKGAKEVKTLIAGDSRVYVQIYICDECIELCSELVVKRDKEKAAETDPEKG